MAIVFLNTFKVLIHKELSQFFIDLIEDEENSDDCEFPKQGTSVENISENFWKEIQS
jgi:hypothetical protein